MAVIYYQHIFYCMQVEWFEGTATVSHGRNGVLISRYIDGRATGDAFVLFDTEEEAAKALTKDRESMGNRYIVLFLCPFVELQKVSLLLVSMEFNKPVVYFIHRF